MPVSSKFLGIVRKEEFCLYRSVANRMSLVFSRHLHHIRILPHMAVPVESDQWLYLKFSGMDIPLNDRFTAKVEHVFNHQFPTDFSLYVCLLTSDVAQHYTGVTEYDFCGT